MYAPELLAMRDRGLIEAGGVSLVHPEFARKSLRYPELNAWQIPSNLIDRRYTHSGLLAAANKSGILVFIRGMYLQGLLLMEESAIPLHLRDIINPRRKLRELAASFGLTLRELAFAAMAYRTDVASVVVGVETTTQIEENIAMAAKGPLPPELAAALESFQPELQEWIVVPAEWERAANHST